MDLLRRFCALPNSRDTPSCALVVAHPDDEIIGAGARLPYIGRCHLLYVTDGAPRNLRDSVQGGYASREAYSRARLEEAGEALKLARAAPVQVRCMGVVDQESAWFLVEIVRSLVTFLRQARPDILLTHAYEGGHPDHDSVSFAVHAACRLLEGEAGGPQAPAIIEMAGYHAWEGGMRTGAFLPLGGKNVDMETRTVRLNRAERCLKQRMLECHGSQRQMLGNFSVGQESFRLSPGYDFGKAPHEGALFYEWFDWGIKGERWRKLALMAQRSLMLEGGC